MITRREFVRRMSALTAATWAAPSLGPGMRLARARTAGIVLDPTGTTLERTFAPAGEGTYVTLTEAPGWPFLTRTLGPEPASGREDRREAIATVVHLTDVHIIDTQAPTRVEFLDRDSDPPQDPVPFSSAWRAQELVTCQVGDAMIRQLNEIGKGPVTGRPFDVAVSTGDNIDNQQQNELEWFLAVLDGSGPLLANSGDPEMYEGVQDAAAEWYDGHYWHPDPIADPRAPDNYKRVWGFPDYEGFIEAAITPFTPVGLNVPWYSCYGNHDGLLSGNAPMNEALDQFNQGPAKVISRPAGMTSGDLMNGFVTQDPTVLAAVLAAPARPITPDPARTFLTPADWVRMHQASPATPGPVGHGYTDQNASDGTLYYTFAIADGVLGISMDTVNRGGYADGSVGREQIAWLEERLAEVHSRYYDAGGGEITTSNEDRLVLLFSHHNIETLSNPFPDPNKPDDERVLAAEFEAFLHRWPNVIGWINGHSHINRVWARPDPDGRTGGFWEINTAAHVDYPEHSRIVELVDNRDGTLSFFVTLVDHAGPASATVAADPLSLAAISRELSVNDPQTDTASKLGELEDRNAELLIAAPFERSPAPPTEPPAPQPEPEPEPGLPATGAGIGAAAIGAAIAGAVRLRQRGATAEDRRA